MKSFAGIIHPNAIQTKKVLYGLTSPFTRGTSFQSMQYQNIEIGSWGAALASNEQKSLWAVLNGTIVNAQEVKKTLKALGFPSTIETDAEVVLYAYKAWQEDFATHLEGDFAIALFDQKKETLLLIRDRLGKKNLYWTEQGDYWLFSTEIKSLLASGLVPQSPCGIGLSSYLYFGYIPQDFSPIKGVNKLLPGHILTINLQKRTSLTPYWSLSQLMQHKRESSIPIACEEFGNLLKSSIHHLVPEKGKLGFFLQNTLGSATLAPILAKRVPNENIHSFTPSSLDPEDVLKDLVTLVWHLDEPHADMEALHIWHLSKQAAGWTHYIVSEVGWSELFAGSSRYFHKEQNTLLRPFSSQLARLPAPLRDSFIIPFCRYFFPSAKWRILRAIGTNPHLMNILVSKGLFHEKERKKVSPSLYHYFNPEVFSQRFHRLTALQGTVDPFLYFDMKTLLPDQTLRQYECLLAPHSLELITPFLFSPLIKWAITLPEEVKCKEGYSGALLSEYLGTHDPFSYNTPFPEKWCLHPLFRAVFSKLEKGLLVEEGFLSPRWVRQQLSYPYLVPKMFSQLWALLILEIWFRLYIAKPVGMTSIDIPVLEFLE